MQADNAGDLVQAAGLYRAVLAQRPDHLEALQRLSIVEYRRGRLRDALSPIERLLAIRPDISEAHYNRGALLHALGRFAEALASYDRAVALQPGYQQALHNRGLSLAALQRFEAAAASYAAALALSPAYAESHFGQGYALFELHRFDEALRSYDKGLRLAPDHAVGHNNRGNTLKELGRGTEAVASFERALVLKPDYAEAFYNRGNALKELERFDEAIASYDKALAIRPNYAAACNNRGLALQELKRFAEARESFDEAVRLDPQDADHRFNRAFLLLLLGLFDVGWREYEWRRKRRTSMQGRFKGPEWKGEPVSGKRVFLYGEQGLGDTILFARFARSLARRGAAVVLGALPRLEGLLQRLDGTAQIVRHGDKLPEFDFHLPLLSVPFILGFAPDRAAAETPYLSADPGRIDQWASRLPAGGFRVGVVWQGNDKGRSVPLAAFAPLGRVPGVRLVSLQKDTGDNRPDETGASAAITTLGPDFDAGPDAFLDTAAVMLSLDLIITADTAVAHLAGALGCPVWIALRHLPDWRWMLDREDSPWYSTARLFRQRVAGDWDEVFARIAGELSRLVAGRDTPMEGGNR